MLERDTVLCGRYRVLRLIGEGGMGAVYEALDLRLSIVVALKQTLVSGVELNQQFEREAQLLARLRHPGLPRVFDYFADDRAQFLVMELIPGDDLSALLERNRAPFPADTVWQWAEQILDVLEYLHGQQPPVIHRDIKPQNLKLTPEGRIILLDFGLAKGALASQATVARSIIAYTPHYAALEQINATGTDERSDLYSLGATLYALCTGLLPSSSTTRVTAIVNGEPDPLTLPHEANGSIPRAVSAVLMQALSINASQRPQSAAAMRAALRAARAGGAARTEPLLAPAVTGVVSPPYHPPVPAPGADLLPTAPRLAGGAPAAAAPARPPERSLRWLWPAVGGGAAALVLLAAVLLGLSSVIAQLNTPAGPPTAIIAEARDSLSSGQATRATDLPHPTAAPAPTAAPPATTAPAAQPTAPATAVPPTPAAAPVLCPQARSRGAETAVACYEPAFAGELLEAGYHANVIALQNRPTLRASQHDPIDGVWARDLDYAASGYSYVLSDMSVLRNSIELLLAGVRPDGVVPEGIFKGRREYVYGQSWDSMPNLIHAVYVYVAKTGDHAFYQAHRGALLRSGAWMAQLDTDDDGLLDQDIFPYGYYNSVENGPLHTYALAKFYAAYLELAELEEAVGQDGAPWRERASRLRAGFHRPLAEGGYWPADQAWPVAWKRADGQVVTVLETFGVFAALHSGLIAPTDARYAALAAALHDNLPALLAGPAPLKLALGGYERAVRRAVDPPLPDWKLDASAPWVVGLAAPAYAAAGYPDDARAVLDAYERAAQQGVLPRLLADARARYGAGQEGSGGTWDYAAWFLAIYGGHYGITMTPEALVVRPRPFLDHEMDGVGNLTYQGATVQIALDRRRAIYSVRADRPIRVVLRPLGSATSVRVNGGPASAEESVVLQPDQIYIVESGDSP